MGAVRLFDRVEGDDVGVVQRSDRAGFPLEPLEPLRVGRHVGGEHFQRHVAVEPGVSGAIHLPHPAFADLGDNFVWAES